MIHISGHRIVKCIHNWHVYNLIYMAIYVCSLVCQRIRVVISVDLYCVHIYVTAYVGQGFLT